MQKATFANYLNTKLEANHSAVFTNLYKHRLLYNTLNSRDKATNSEDLYERYNKCVDCEQTGN